MLKTWFPSVPSTVLDIGCGTGSLTVLLASLGYKVTGVDLSPVMIVRAKAKTITKGFEVEFHIMDAALPFRIKRVESREDIRLIPAWFL
ncbi:MAG: class I SAM-dependent methyltransferase [Anaerolineales bacterium]